MQQFTTATKTAIIFAMEPVSAAVFAYFMISEVLTNIQLSGAILIVSCNC
jgi:drug/metabolite transporter (DMT)-like permease